MGDLTSLDQFTIKLAQSFPFPTFWSVAQIAKVDVILAMIGSFSCSGKLFNTTLINSVLS